MVRTFIIMLSQTIEVHHRYELLLVESCNGTGKHKSVLSALRVCEVGSDVTRESGFTVIGM